MIDGHGSASIPARAIPASRLKRVLQLGGASLSMNQVGRDSVEPYFRSLEIRAESRPTVHDDLCKFKKADASRRPPGAHIAGANCRVALKRATGVLAAPARE